MTMVRVVSKIPRPLAMLVVDQLVVLLVLLPKSSECGWATPRDCSVSSLFSVLCFNMFRPFN